MVGKNENVETWQKLAKVEINWAPTITADSTMLLEEHSAPVQETGHRRQRASGQLYFGKHQPLPGSSGARRRRRAGRRNTRTTKQTCHRSARQSLHQIKPARSRHRLAILN